MQGQRYADDHQRCPDWGKSAAYGVPHGLCESYISHRGRRTYQAATSCQEMIWAQAMLEQSYYGDVSTPCQSALVRGGSSPIKAIPVPAGMLEGMLGKYLGQRRTRDSCIRK